MVLLIWQVRQVNVFIYGALAFFGDQSCQSQAKLPGIVCRLGELTLVSCLSRIHSSAFVMIIMKFIDGSRTEECLSKSHKQYCCQQIWMDFRCGGNQLLFNQVATLLRPFLSTDFRTKFTLFLRSEDLSRKRWPSVLKFRKPSLTWDC